MNYYHFLSGSSCFVLVGPHYCYYFFPEMLHSPMVLETFRRIKPILELPSLVPTELLKCASKSHSIKWKGVGKGGFFKWLTENDRNTAAKSEMKSKPDWLIGSSSFFCVCYTPDLVGALTGIRMNSVSRWHHWFPRRYSQEGRARVDPGFVNADAILPCYYLLCLTITNLLHSAQYPHFKGFQSCDVHVGLTFKIPTYLGQQ